MRLLANIFLNQLHLKFLMKIKSKIIVTTYTDSEDVLNTIQDIFDWLIICNSNIDTVAFISNSHIIACSDISPQKLNVNFIPSLLENFHETTTDTLGKNTNLYHASLITKNLNYQFQSWTLVYPYKNYRLAFSSKLQANQKLQLEQSTIFSYVQDISPLIKAYDRLT